MLTHSVVYVREESMEFTATRGELLIWRSLAEFDVNKVMPPKLTKTKLRLQNIMKYVCLT